MKTQFFLGFGLWVAVCGCAAGATLGGSVVATTNYVFRGLTQTDHGAALQGDLHLKTSKGWFVGVWGSFDDEPARLDLGPELNLYLGRAWTLTPEWAASVHYARYLYPDNSYYLDYDYDELQGRLNFQDRVTMSVAVTSDVLRYSIYRRMFGEGRQWSYEASLRQPLWRNLSLTAGLGHYDLRDQIGDAYWAWSGGLQVNLRQLQMTVTRFNVDDTAWRVFGEQTADARWALTAAWRF